MDKQLAVIVCFVATSISFTIKDKVDKRFLQWACAVLAIVLILNWRMS